MRKGNRIRTKGYGFLPEEEKQDIQKQLQAAKVAFRLVGKGLNQEITLLNINITATASGIVPTVIKAILDAFAIDIGQD
jgi:hypothetical protein